MTWIWICKYVDWPLIMSGGGLTIQSLWGNLTSLRCARWRPQRGRNMSWWFRTRRVCPPSTEPSLENHEMDRWTDKEEEEDSDKKKEDEEEDGDDVWWMNILIGKDNLNWLLDGDHNKTYLHSSHWKFIKNLVISLKTKHFLCQLTMMHSIVSSAA